MNVQPWMPLAGAALAAAICVFFSLRAAYRRLLVDNLPTSKTTGVFIGLVELKGSAESERPLRSPLTETACVAYRWRVREHWSRTVSETYEDSQGRTQTRWKTESGWETVLEGASHDEPFFLKDDRGSIRILPKGAKLEQKALLSRECTSGDPLYFGKGPPNAIANSDGKREFTEEAVPLHAPIYVIGQARQRTDTVAAEIAHHEGGPLFLVSTRREEHVSASMRGGFWLLGLCAVALVPAGLAWSESLANRQPGTDVYVQAALYALAAWLAGWVLVVYNSLVNLRQRVGQAWANVDVELKRRADLLPALVKVVSALRDHEKRVQAEVAAMRTQAGATAPGRPGPDPASVRGPLLALVEAYPELKSSDSFLKLQQQLTETEERIALARGYFNDIATFWNTRIALFPYSLVALLGVMRPRALMQAGGFERGK